MASLLHVDGPLLERVLPPAAAAAALREALLEGLDPASGTPRQAVPLAHGQLLLMPAEHAGHAGVKLVTVAARARPGQPRIAGVYVLFDAVGLQPVAVVDGTALTTLRTPAVSALAVERLAAPDAGHLVVFGTGPQAWGHVRALRQVRPLRTVTVVGRDTARVDRFVARARSNGLEAQPGEPAAVGTADVVVCATTSRTPLFDAALLPGHACVVAVGSHEPDARELGGDVLAAAGVVVVEDVETALREAGEVVQAVAAGFDPAALVPLADLVRAAGGPPPRSGPSVFKGVGMAWQDLVVAAAAVREARTAQP